MIDLIERNLHEDDGVRRTVSAVFQVNSGGLNWQAKHSNFLPLVRFCLENQAHSIRLTDSEARYLKSNLRLLFKHLQTTETLELNSMVSLLNDDASEFNADKLYQFLLRNWEELKSWSVTYRALYALTSPISTWKEDAKTKSQLLEILKRISDEWESPDMQG